MRQRVLCFLAVVSLISLLLPVPVHACKHYNKYSDRNKLVRKNHVDPQEGIPGYTGDFYCPVCGDLVIEGEPIPATEDTSGSYVHPQTIPGEPAKPDPPADPGKPAEPETPVKPKAGTTPKPTATPKPTSKPKPTAKAKTETTPKPVKATGVTAKPAGAKAEKTGIQKRKPFSHQYPYRRVRMYPEEGIYAEAAGTLIWPAVGSPFRSLFGE